MANFPALGRQEVFRYFLNVNAPSRLLFVPYGCWCCHCNSNITSHLFLIKWNNAKATNKTVTNARKQANPPSHNRVLSLRRKELSMSPDSEVVYLIKNENNAMLLTLNVLHHQQKQQIQYQQQQHQQGSNALRPCDCHWWCFIVVIAFIFTFQKFSVSVSSEFPEWVSITVNIY